MHLDPARAVARGAGNPTDHELGLLSEKFERWRARDIVQWAVERFHPELSVAASMTDAVLVDLAVRAEPNVDFVFIDTGYHFPETLETLDRVQQRYGIEVRVLRVPPQDPPLWRSDPERCCSDAKVAQLDIALDGKRAWMSGLRRAEAATRAAAPIVSRDQRGLVKVNPLATWSDDDVVRYVAQHDVPVNPLLARGYRSIGCAPCTRPVAEGEDTRAGRWPGLEKLECGLHL